ncbi:MAG TPA: hypothetical protein VM888_07465 [Chitinophagaceae bacterium]|nr:hypothetical protein [Chitinophagaceae bacterium]
MFRQKTPGNIIVLLIFGLLLKMPLFLFAKQITATQNDEDYYHWLLTGINSMGANNAFTCALLSFLLLYIQALMINFLINDFRLITKQTYLPAMAYLLITTLLPEWNYLSSPLVATTFIIWIFIKLFRLYNMANARGQIFNIGLLLGISSYLYFPSASFIICILLGLVIIKPFRVNEVFLFFMGCLTPYYFLGAYLFLTDTLSFAAFVPHVAVKVPDIKGSIWLAVSTLLLTVPFLIGGYFIQLHLHKMLIQVRKAWSILLLYLLLAFFVPFINSNSSFSNWILLAAPFACFHASTYYYPAKKWMPNTFFFLLTGYILYLQYGTNLWMK